jgi:starch synthase (maltosyl-transferring)
LKDTRQKNKMSAFPKVDNFVIENIRPRLDDGAFPIKREPMDYVEVLADLFRHGHEKYTATLLWKAANARKWNREPMVLINNDTWGAKFQVKSIGVYQYTIECTTLNSSDAPTMADQVLEVRVDPVYARFGTWYEMFPRSQGTNPNASASWDDCIGRLNDIKDMGFDTIYLVPIHPIGETKRKGPNNTLVAKPGDPGCPYAVGNKLGGHYAVDPELGGMEGFDRFAKSCSRMGFKMVLDIALNCSPDHPHVKEHPDWFFHEKDGTIKCAENPPKKYEDIYPYDYYNKDWKSLWQEIRDMMLYWADKGFSIFRIDNPHTKPFAFWQWVIPEIKKVRPDVVFLAEAFTRPKMMHRLAKIGFDMSYTYFTWRVEKWEIEEYFKELTQSPAKEYMRGMLFPTTPDIQPEILQNAPASAFKMRLMLAGTLSSLCGMYNGYELCETEPYPGKEELNFSEKYQYMVRDWNAPGNIKSFVSRLNAIRIKNPALQEYDNLEFHYCGNPEIMVYSKKLGDNVILCVANLDVHNPQSGMISLDLSKLGLKENSAFLIKDLLDDRVFVWNGSENFVMLDPSKSPGHIFLVRPF